LELTKLNTEDYKNKIYSKEELLVKYSELKGKKYLRYNLTDLTTASKDGTDGLEDTR